MKLLETYYKRITRGLTPNILKDLLPMDVTPAAKWFLADNKQEYYDYTDDFPCIVPPSPLTWLEYEAPDRIVSSERVVLNNQLKRAGALCITYEIDPALRLQALNEDYLLRYMQALDGGSRQFINWEGNRAARRAWGDKAREAAITPRWISVWNIILEPIGGNDFLGLGLYGMYLDERGRVIKGLNSTISGISEEQLAILGADPMFDMFNDCLPFMFALSLSHCKNVTTSELPLPPAVARKRRERGLPAFTYRILDINPMRKASQASARAGESEQRNALHFVRGHMKTYSTDRPLFGKLTGTFWWHLHLAGKEEAGMVAKEYRVNPT